MTADIEVFQDRAVGPDGELGGWMDVFWCEEHKVCADDFVDAVIRHCREWARNFPAMPWDVEVARKWQRDRAVGDSVMYERRDEIPEGSPIYQWRPVTVLDCEPRFFGAAACSVAHCTRPVMSSQAFEAVWEVDAEYVALNVRLCDAHREQIPNQTYRLCFIPVGATIVLPAEEIRDDR